MPFLPWPQIAACLEMVTDWEYKRNYVGAVGAYMSGAAFGGLRESNPVDLLPEWARPAWLLKPGEVRVRLKGREASDFRLALKLGLVSQRLLTHYSEA